MLEAEKTLDWNISSEEEDAIVKLFLSQRDEDDLNAIIIANAISGYRFAEAHDYGIASSVLEKSNLWEGIAIYSGIGAINEKDLKDIGGLPFGERIQAISKFAYVSDKEHSAANALFQMKHRKLGDKGIEGSVVDRMNEIPYHDIMKTLRAIHVPRVVMDAFPARGNYSVGLKPAHKGERVKIGYQERERAARYLLYLIKTKADKPLPHPKTFEGWIVASKEKRYFVQRNRVPLSGQGLTDIFYCTCPNNWSAFISTKLRTDHCKHINYVRERYIP